MDTIKANYEEQLRDSVINKILVVSAIVFSATLIATHLRALKIGWHYRDLLQIISVAVIVFLAVNRHKINSAQKAIYLLVIFFVGGFSGFSTLGMLGGTVFIFPTSAVIMAVFFPSKATWIYIGLSLALCCVIAVGFCTQANPITFDPVLLLTDFRHWLVYISCIAAFFAIMHVAVYTYRRSIAEMVGKISTQQEKLEKQNQDLIEAAKNIKQLSGLIPICSSCKKIRDDQGFWNQLELYIEEHSDANFTHGICPSCAEELFPEVFDDDLSDGDDSK